MPNQQGFSYANWAAVSGAGWTVFVVGASASDASSEDFPSKGTISHVEIQLRTIVPALGAAGCPTTITAQATWDAANTLLALPQVATAVSAVPSGTDRGGTVIAAGVLYKQPGDATAKRIYVGVKLDLGTAEARVRVYWEK